MQTHELYGLHCPRVSRILSMQTYTIIYKILIMCEVTWESTETKPNNVVTPHKLYTQDMNYVRITPV